MRLVWLDPIHQEMLRYNTFSGKEIFVQCQERNFLFTVTWQWIQFSICTGAGKDDFHPQACLLKHICWHMLTLHTDSDFDSLCLCCMQALVHISNLLKAPHPVIPSHMRQASAKRLQMEKEKQRRPSEEMWAVWPCQHQHHAKIFVCICLPWSSVCSFWPLSLWWCVCTAAQVKNRIVSQFCFTTCTIDFSFYMILTVTSVWKRSSLPVSYCAYIILTHVCPRNMIVLISLCDMEYCAVWIPEHRRIHLSTVTASPQKVSIQVHSSFLPADLMPACLLLLLTFTMTWLRVCVLSVCACIFGLIDGQALAPVLMCHI